MPIIRRSTVLCMLLISCTFFISSCGDNTPDISANVVATRAAIAVASVNVFSLTPTPRTEMINLTSAEYDAHGSPVNCNPPATSAVAATNRPDAANRITVKGSDTMVNLGEHWARDFMQANQGEEVVVYGGGSQIGITALINRQTTIAEASRAMTAAEIQQAKTNGVNPEEIVVALDGVAVVVNPANPVSTITIPQLSGIYSGKITNWKDVGGPDQPITVLSRNGESGTNQYFKEQVLQMGDTKAPIYWGSNVICLPSSQDEQDQVSAKQWAIAYFGLGYVRPNVKALTLAKNGSSPAVAPNVANVQNKTYPISRDLYFYSDGTPNGLAKDYINFVLSAAGQKIVEQEEFVPLTQK